MRQLPKDNNNNNNKNNSNSRSSETACESRCPRVDYSEKGVLVAVDALEAVAKVVAALAATAPSRRF